MLNYGKYTNREEVACQHCGDEMPRGKSYQHILDVFNWVRDGYGQSLVITSGYRCPQHPIEVAKPGGPGMHTYGGALDVSIANRNPIRLLQLLMSQPTVRGLGINPGNFIHFDCRKEPALWVY